MNPPDPYAYFQAMEDEKDLHGCGCPYGIACLHSEPLAESLDTRQLIAG